MDGVGEVLKVSCGQCSSNLLSQSHPTRGGGDEKYNYFRKISESFFMNKSRHRTPVIHKLVLQSKTPNLF